MDAITAIGLVSTAVETFIKVEPIIAKGISDLKPFAVALYEKYTGKPIAPDELKSLAIKIDNMHSAFQAPIPPDNEQ